MHWGLARREGRENRVPRSVGSLAVLHKQKHFLQGQQPHGIGQRPPANNKTGPATAADCRPMLLHGEAAHRGGGHQGFSLWSHQRCVYVSCLFPGSASPFFSLSLSCASLTPSSRLPRPPCPLSSLPILSPGSSLTSCSVTQSSLTAFSWTVHILWSPSLGDSAVGIGKRLHCVCWSVCTPAVC